MEIGHGDRGRYYKSDTTSPKCSQTISNWKPARLGGDQHSCTDADQASYDCPAEQSGLACSAA
jgi:hypothetical protein